MLRWEGHRCIAIFLCNIVLFNLKREKEWGGVRGWGSTHRLSVVFSAAVTHGGISEFIASWLHAVHALAEMWSSVVLSGHHLWLGGPYRSCSHSN